MMSANNGGGAVGIGMVELKSRQDYQLQEEQEAEGLSYKGRFKSILTDHYDNEETWWGAVEDLMKKDTDFVEKVAVKLQEEEEKQRKDAIVEVMVDLLIDVEGITEHKGLVYVLEERLHSYPLKLMAVELLKRGADPNKEKGYSGSTPLHLAITEKKLDLVKTLLEKGAHLEAKDDDGYTPLLKAVTVVDDAPEGVVAFLLEHGADVQAVAEDRKTALHFAAQKGNKSLMRSIIERGLSVDVEDKDGWRPLHEAAHFGSNSAVEVLVENRALVNARCHWKRTPLHVAAEKGEKELITLLLENKADANVTDLDLNTPLDLAAKQWHKEAVELILDQSFCPKKDDAVKKILDRAVDPDANSTVSDNFVKEQIRRLSPLSVASMFKSKKCDGEGRYQFLKTFVNNPMLKKTTMAILDAFVLGNRRRQVNCEIIDADMKGIPPDSDGFDQTSQSLLDVIVEQNDKEPASHIAIRAILEHKWKTFARRLFFISFVLYAVRMLFFGLALLIAARPELDNPGCYRDGWDYFRGICEGISILFLLLKAFDQFQEIISFPRAYIKNFYNYQQLLAVILPLLIIPFRAATTWCASTGDGYCNDPTLLSPAANATNVTLHFNLDCITASQIQWIAASLAYMANAVLVVEFVAQLSRTMRVYVFNILEVVMKDVLKFTVIFTVGLYVFVGSFYLALRSGVTVQASTGAIVSDLEKFELQTLYPWHVAFTGFQILIHSGGVLGREYYAANDDGQYVGYHWFSVVLYLAFLFAVTVVLLSLLIAQMNDTYRKVQENIEGTSALSKARIIARLQKGSMCPYNRGLSYWTYYYQKYIGADMRLSLGLTAEELRQKDQLEKLDTAEKRTALIEQKINRLTGSSGGIMRRLDMKENSAQEIKSLLEQKVDRLAKMMDEVMKRLPGPPKDEDEGVPAPEGDCMG